MASGSDMLCCSASHFGVEWNRILARGVLLAARPLVPGAAPRGPEWPKLRSCQTAPRFHAPLLFHSVPAPVLDKPAHALAMPLLILVRNITQKILV
jgi:hypothetical protein